MSPPSANNSRSLTLAGAATVAQAALLRDELAAATQNALDLVVEFETTEVDVTAIQLLIAASRSIQARGGSLRLADPPSGALLETLTQGGFIRHGQEDAIWATGVSR